MSKKAIVTGGAGFIGSHMADRLLREGFQVVVIDSLIAGKRENVPLKARFYKCDIKDIKKIMNIFKREKPDYVFHFAAQINPRFSVENPWADAEENIVGGLNVIEASRRIRVKKFIFSSSGGAIYGGAQELPTPESYLPHPYSPYGVSKLSVEEYLHCFRHIEKNPLTSICMRYANVYGPRQDSSAEAGAIAIFVKKLLVGERPTIFGDGKNTRDWVYVGDVVEANMLALKVDNPHHKIFNVGTGKETSVNEMFQKLKEILKSNIKPIHGQAKPGEERRSVLDCCRAHRELNWRPKVSFDDGLVQTVQWYNQYEPRLSEKIKKLFKGKGRIRKS
ncbi:MAG: GDP-mannose 4,6-dehydratase [Patescibacteria group bacterium]|nr:GDP-mannose 4,6-dehydratase [Patescibacteria group bacterium]